MSRKIRKFEDINRELIAEFPAFSGFRTSADLTEIAGEIGGLPVRFTMDEWIILGHDHDPEKQVRLMHGICRRRIAETAGLCLI